jgi:hypothetical protein
VVFDKIGPTTSDCYRLALLFSATTGREVSSGDGRLFVVWGECFGFTVRGDPFVVVVVGGLLVVAFGCGSGHSLGDLVSAGCAWLCFHQPANEANNDTSMMTSSTQIFP